MRSLKVTTLFIAFILCVSSVLLAKTNKYGVSDVRRVNFSTATRVGNVLLPQGDYEVRHVMEADNHIMVFKRLGSGKAAEARVNCNLVALKQKVDRDQFIYSVNAANERVLQTLRFKGDSAEHVF
jgi:hypothetical protein